MKYALFVYCDEKLHSTPISLRIATAWPMVRRSRIPGQLIEQRPDSDFRVIDRISRDP
jgi:hypothetical protein